MSRNYRWTALLLALCFAVGMIFAGCGQEDTAETEAATNAEGTATIYYLSDDETQLLSLSTPLTSTGDEAVKDLFQLLTGGSFPDGKAAVPSDVALDHIAWQESSLVLYLTGNYPQTGTRKETLCRAALAKTMLRATGVSGLQIYVNDQPLCESDGTQVGLITADMFLDHVNNDVNQQRHVTMTLYFADSSGTSLVQRVIEKDISIDTGLEEAVIQQLIEGPTDKDCQAVIAPATSVLGISVRNRTCYVNLSDEFINQALNVPETLAVYAVVNSLTELPEVDQVQIAIEGSSDIRIADDISLAAPLKADYSLVTEWVNDGGAAKGQETSGGETTAAATDAAAQTTAAPAQTAAPTTAATAAAQTTAAPAQTAAPTTAAQTAATTAAASVQSDEQVSTTAAGAAPAGAGAVN